MQTSEQTWVQQWRHYISHETRLDSSSVLQIPMAPCSADEPAFWPWLNQQYPRPADHINLNFGGVSAAPILVEKAYLHYYACLNASPSYMNWKVMEQARNLIKDGLGILLGTEGKNLALFRNATEALNNAIMGIPLQTGDVVVACEQDYVKCVSAWKQRSLREGIHIQWVQLRGKESPEEILNLYCQAFDHHPKVVHLTHVINWNGLILPAQKIAEEARKRGILVILDAAHSLGVLDIDVNSIPCNYLGAPTHKWLNGPVAGGVLYIHPEQQADTFPLAAAVDPMGQGMSKFEELSIGVLPAMLALGHALDFHFLLGTRIKRERLSQLRKSWVNNLPDTSVIDLLTPNRDDQVHGLASFRIPGWSPFDIEKHLWDKHRLHVVGFEWPGMSGVRVTPGITTTFEDIDCLTEALQAIRA